MRIGKKGFVNVNTIKGYVVGITLFIVLILILAQLIPTGVTAGNTLNGTGVPLGSFFATGGVTWLIIMAGVVILAVMAFLGKIGQSK